MGTTEHAENSVSPGEFAAMYIDAFPKLCSVAAKEVGRSSAEDVVQQAAMLCIERLGTFEPGTDGVAWMSAFVRLTAKNYRRSEHRRQRRDRADRSSRDRAPAGPAQPDGRLFSSEMRHILRNAIETLEHYQRVCLVLKVVMGHSYADIATILGIPEATARSHAHRARKALAERIEGAGHAERFAREKEPRHG